ncbi:hypothetical protein WSM22_29600 [Cytophagales bacterium WSM2-2]|nr:hypothetical protein WSM22_29600 [Cytophagales bacterium WSM2-2]
MNKVLIISFSNLKFDARVKRQLSFLVNDFDVTVVCYDGHENMPIFKIKPPSASLFRKVVTGVFLLFRLYNLAYQKLYGQKLSLKKDYDLIIANDVEALPLAFQLKGHAKVIFDAHEYAPRHFENKISWRIFFQGFNTFLCRKYIPQVDLMTTIGEGLAQEYATHFGVKPFVITNATPYHSLDPIPTNPKKIKLVHQGIANPSRKLELMFEMMDFLDERYSLDLILVEPTFRSGIKYMKRLKILAKKTGRINLLPPRPANELIYALNQYDLGIVLIPPVNFNYKNTLPNKFFECIQARIGLAIGPIPEMRKITDQYKIGVVSGDFSAKSLAEKISALTAEEIDSFKQNTERAAKELNAEKNKEIFVHLISALK